MFYVSHENHKAKNLSRLPKDKDEGIRSIQQWEITNSQRNPARVKKEQENYKTVRKQLKPWH